MNSLISHRVITGLGGIAAVIESGFLAYSGIAGWGWFLLWERYDYQF